MFSKLTKTAKFMAGWLDWTLLYPLWQTPEGRQQIIRTAVAILRRKPEKLAEFQQIIEKVMAEVLTQSIVTDASGRHAPPKPPDETKDDPEADVRRVPRREGGRDISELKSRLGLVRPGQTKKS